MDVAARLASVRQSIERADRNPDDVTIVAVTKGFDTSVCRLAIQAGLRILGENRVQEALQKMDEVDGAEWHLIGHLQSNKVRQAAAKFALIHSIDSLHLAETLAKSNPQQHVLIEVNVAREAQKSGIDPAHALELVAATDNLLTVRGLMAMGPADGDPTQAFTELRRLRDEAQERIGRSLPVLSMGMSGDFETALAAGSTMLRLGQALFGPRPK